jgi:predicted enzyme related to lactoylglutathione lyase
LPFQADQQRKPESGHRTPLGPEPRIDGTLSHGALGANAHCGVEAERVVIPGRSIESPKEPIGEYGFCVVARDPDGNRFGLHSMR